VDDVVALIDARISRLANEPAPLLEAAGRVLARDAVASYDAPPFARAAMDGFAVLAADTAGPGDGPARLRIVGEVMPGRAPAVTVAPGTCARIATGAPLPAGADAVVRIEDAEILDGEAVVRVPVAAGRHVGAAGEDVAAGTVFLRAGRRLRAHDLGVLSSLGFASVSCVRRPRVAVLVTGDELLPAGAPPEGFAVPDANTPMLRALVERDGGVAAAAERLGDDRDALRAAIRAAAEASDCVLLAGGSSVGRADFAPAVVRELGELLVLGVALRPGAPAGLGFVAGRPVFVLPGNPFAALGAYELFAGRAVRRLGGRHPGFPHTTVGMPLAADIASTAGRTDFVRVRIEAGRVAALPARGAILSATSAAHGFVRVPLAAERLRAGEQIDVRLF
jgi:molybdopterin molybdotransferase